MKKVTFKTPYELQQALGIKKVKLVIEKEQYAPANYHVRITLGGFEVYVEIDEFINALKFLEIL